MTTLVRPRLRALTLLDVARVVELPRATGVFRDSEIAIAEEVVREAVKPGSPEGAPAPEDRPYHALGAELDGRLVGWICWGATPCTIGTWDLYWLAVDPGVHGRGVGTALVEAMERALRGRARLIAVNTSGRDDYAPTRRFYEARGYTRAAVVRDYYAPGDDQVIYTKRLPGA